jgi:hypothetical protein
VVNIHSTANDGNDWGPPMLYFVLCDYGRNGHAWAERDPSSMDFNSTVRDIREGQLSSVVKVLEVSEGRADSRLTAPRTS